MLKEGFKLNFRKGFTLAEVLITLGIIGVVAALTIPTLVKNYQKKVTITRLTDTYSILTNVFKLAEVDYGDPSRWGMGIYLGQDAVGSASIDSYVEKYMLPYMQGAKYEPTGQTLAQMGFKNGITYPNGTAVLPPNATAKPLILKNGVYIFRTSAYVGNTDNRYYVSIIFYIDVNGPSGDNVVGKDVFVIEQLFDGIGPRLHGEVGWTYSPATNKFTYTRPTREDLFSKCSRGDSYSRNCGALIKIDGWRFAKNYPWF